MLSLAIPLGSLAAPSIRFKAIIQDLGKFGDNLDVKSVTFSIGTTRGVDDELPALSMMMEGAFLSMA